MKRKGNENNQKNKKGLKGRAEGYTITDSNFSTFWRKTKPQVETNEKHFITGSKIRHCILSKFVGISGLKQEVDF